MVTRTLLGQDSAGYAVVQDEAGNVVHVPIESVPPQAVDQYRTTGKPVPFVPQGTVIPLFNNQIPTPDTFDALTVPYVGAQDIIYHKFYDSAALTSAAANQGSFFLAPQALIYNGNLKGNGTLSNNERFFMTGIRFELENNDTSNPLDVVDVVQTLRLGTYQFTLAQKAYVLGKLMDFIDPLTYVTLNTNYYSVKPFLTYNLPLPVAIGKQFQFSTDWTLTAATLGSTTRLFNYLHGFWYRNVQ